MKKYIIYIDYKANYTANGGKDYEYINAKAKNLLDVIAEADALYNENVYLIRIMESVTKPSKSGEYRSQTFHAVLARRCAGWHRNSEEFFENGHMVMRTWSKNFESIEII